MPRDIDDDFGGMPDYEIPIEAYNAPEFGSAADAVPEGGDPMAKAATEIARLAALDQIAYDQQRAKAAKALGIRAPVLDQQVEEARRAAQPHDDGRDHHAPNHKGGLAEIEVLPGMLETLADQAEAALLASGADVFQRAEMLLRPGSSEVPAADGRTTIAAGLHALTQNGLREEMGKSASWQKYDARTKKMKVIDPPALIAGVLADRKGIWKLRTCTGVITCPTLRPDCSILIEPGYDSATRLYHMQDKNLVMPEISEHPTKSDAEAALSLIKSLFVEFPFVTDADRAVALSLVLSTIVRGALGMVPLHAFTAPTPGSGKSFISDVTTAIVSGRICPVITAGKTEEELEKRLGAMLLAGYPVISIDNISAGLSGDALCQVTERPTVRIRILGKSETPECEFRGILIANGNNLVVVGDMTRRTLLSALDAEVERPEDRQFTFDPVMRVAADRGRFVAAGMTVIRAYVAAGQPGKLPQLASYGSWSDRVRSALVWLGEADPALTMRAVRDADPVLSMLCSVMQAWLEAFGDAGMTGAEVVAELSSFDHTTDHGARLAALRAAIAPVAAVRGVIDASRLGYWLRQSKGRPVAGLKFISSLDRMKTAVWRVVPAHHDAGDRT